MELKLCLISLEDIVVNSQIPEAGLVLGRFKRCDRTGPQV